jgi:hypothetical protein
MVSKLINIDEFEGKNKDFVAFCRYFHSQNVTPIAHEKLIKVVFRGAGKSIIGGQIFIYSCSASFISFESDCFYSL